MIEFWKTFIAQEWSDFAASDWKVFLGNPALCDGVNFPSAWQELIINIYRQYQENPTGVWADYNYIYRLYNYILRIEAQGLLCPDSIPPGPLVSDYPDLTSTATIFQDDGNWVQPYNGDEIGIKFYFTH